MFFLILLLRVFFLAYRRRRTHALAGQLFYCLYCAEAFLFPFLGHGALLMLRLCNNFTHG